MGVNDFEGSRAKREITFPLTRAKAHSADVFLVNGCANPSLVQRIAAWMVGLFFLVIGFAAVSVGVDAGVDSFLTILPVCLLFILVGIRVFRNGFRRRDKESPSTSLARKATSGR